MLELTPYGRSGHYLRNYNPFRELEEFEKNFWNSDTPTEFKTDIKDTGDSYLLEADLPGFNKEDIKIDIDDDSLTIHGERHSEAEEKDNKGNYIRCERSYGSFSRSFNLSGVKTDQIKAAYENVEMSMMGDRYPKKYKWLRIMTPKSPE